MKIYIITDMEGISGIWRPEQVQKGHPEYEKARRLLCEDVNSAIAGAFDGGATDIVVLDGHGGGDNFILEMLDERATYETVKNSLEVMPSLDGSFNGLMQVGCHAMAGTLNGFLDHTQSSTSWFNFYVNGRKFGEIGQAGAYAGVFGVPVIMITGDKAACEEARSFFGNIELVSVKEGLGRNRAKCISPKLAHKMIHDAAMKAVQHIKTGAFKPFILKPPIEMKLELCRSDYADEYATRPGVQRLDARTVRKMIENPREIYCW
ncbi:M55 family metallopeptidase [Candidatus Bathyarchaeota archaeon]|nr:M55 family metallopeptidase [Candidatus Bathyarchaeota archaeon]MBS7612738.1 M55 family metallopeptidase [Candidatus Bathyarchaeota archaeon]